MAGIASASHAAACPDDVNVVQSGTRLIVTCLGSTWTIETALFDGPNVPALTKCADGPTLYEFEVTGRLAGVGVDIALSATIVRAGPAYRMTLSISGLPSRTVDLKAWCDGLATYEASTTSQWPKRFALAAGAVLSAPAGLLIRLDKSFFESPAKGLPGLLLMSEPVTRAPWLELKAPGIGAFSANVARVRPTLTSPNGGPGPATQMTLVGASFQGKPLPLGDAGRSTALAFSPEANPGEITVSAWREQGLRTSFDAAWGIGVLDAHSKRSASASRVALANVALSGDLATLRDRPTLKFRLPVSNQWIDAPAFSVQVAGVFGSELVTWAFADGTALDSLAIPAKLLTVSAPVADASACDVCFPLTDASIWFNDPPPSAQGPLDPTMIRLGDTPAVVAPLGLFDRDDTSLARGGKNLARVRLRRTEDLFDLSFLLPGSVLILDDKGANLVAASGAAAAGQPDRIVCFPPQHLSEESFFYQEQPGANGQAASDCDTPPGEAPQSPEPTGGYEYPGRAALARETGWCAVNALGHKTYLAQTQLSGPSRLVFERQSKDAAGGSRPLTIATLTDWRELALQVHKRAQTANHDVEAELTTAGFTKSMQRDDFRSHFKDSLVGPSATETSLELMSGLVFSPDRLGKFVVPGATPRKGRINPSWFARLDPDTATALRAIWSVDFQDETDAADGPFFTPLNRSQRRELFMLSSVYGMPALRAVDVAGNDVAASLVRRPKPDWDFLDTYQKSSQNGVTVLSEGVFCPRPFDVDEVLLTSRGANLSVQWIGEPPAPSPANAPQFLRGKFNVEKAVLRTVGGRDAYVLVAEKGYLFPHGHRVTLVQLSQRIRRTFKHDPDGPPTFYLSTHWFIVRKKPRKTFPTAVQPYAGRDYPATTVDLLTQRTPDLVQPRYIPLPNTSTDDDTFAFWPQTRAPTEDWTSTDLFKEDFYSNVVPFEFSMDGDATKVTAPAIFVSNGAVHTPDFVAALVDYYRRLGYDQSGAGPPHPSNSADPYDGGVLQHLRLETHADRTATFAPSLKSGDTQYKLKQLRLGARGRLADDASVSGAADIVYSVNAFMEGADEPPFHPTMVDAAVSIPRLDQMLGHPQGAVVVSYEPTYVETAFAQATNPGQVFLHVVGPEISLDLTSQGDAGGGLAKPSAKLGALSRTAGFVGGKPQAPAPIPGAANLLAHGVGHGAGAGAGPPPSSGDRVGTDTQVTFDVSSALGGHLDPAQFFSDAKFLGIVSLADIIRVAAIGAAPVLQQAEEYAGAATSEALELARTAAADLGDGLDGLYHGASVPQPTQAGLPSLSLDQLYPELMAKYVATRDACQACKNIGPGADDADKIAALVRVYQTGRALLLAAEDVAAHPMPAVIADAIADVQAMVQQAQSWAQTARAALANGDVLRAWIDSTAAGFLQVALGDGLYEALFGPPDLETPVSPNALPGAPHATRAATAAAAPCGPDVAAQLQLLHALLANPSDAVGFMRRALFQSQLAVPLARALDAVQKLLPPTAATWSRRRLAGSVVAGLRTVVAKAIADQAAVQNIPVAPSSVRGPSVSQFALDVVAVAESALKTVGSLDQLNVAAGNIAGALDASIARLKSSARADLGVAQTAASTASDNLVLQKQALSKPLAPADLAEARLRLSQYEAELQAANDLVTGLGAIANLSKDDLTRAVKKAVLEAVTPAVDAYVARAAEVAQEGVDQLLGRVLGTATQLLSMLDTAGSFAAAGLNAATVLQGWLDVPATPPWRSKLAQLGFDCAFASLAQSDDLATWFVALSDALDAILLPASVAASAATRCASELAQVRGAVQRLAVDLEALERSRFSLAPDTHPKPGKLAPEQINIIAPIAISPTELYPACNVAFFNALGEAFEIRRRVISDLANVMRLVQRLHDDLKLVAQQSQGDPSGLSATDFANLQGQVAALLTPLRSLAGGATPIQAMAEQADPWKDTMSGLASVANPVVSGAVNAAVKDAKTAFGTLGAAWTGLAITDLDTFASQLEGFGVDAERQLAATALQAAALGDALVSELNGAVTDCVKAAVVPLCALYQGADDVLTSLLGLLNGGDTGGDIGVGSVLQAIGRPTIDRITNAQTLVKNDLRDLSALQASPGDRGALHTLIENWSPAGTPGQPGLVAAAKILIDIGQALGRGQIGSLISFDSVTQMLRATLDQLLPTRITASYAYDTDLEDYPSDDPVFAMDPAQDPGPKPPAQDLELRASIEVDLLKRTRTVSASGRMRPFKLHLLGDAFDLLTIHFKGAQFTVPPGGSTSFKTEVGNVELGELLNFIKPVQSFMSPGDGDGLHIGPSISPLGILATYKYGRDIIPVGEMSFLNVRLSASMLLPFTDSAALFSFAFASRDKPFMIVATPYGGGGFVGLKAHASGIFAFEIQIEFGAATAIQFGPLSGSGRVTAGIYLLQQQDQGRRLEGFVHAVGEGHIACFGICVSLEVRVVQVGSNMYGSASFSFTFSFGIGSISYSVTAQYTIAGGSGGGSEMQAFQDRVLAPGPQFAALSSPAECAAGDERPNATIIRDVPSRITEWAAYRKHFATPPFAPGWAGSPQKGRFG